MADLLKILTRQNERRDSDETHSALPVRQHTTDERETGELAARLRACGKNQESSRNVEERRFQRRVKFSFERARLQPRRNRIKNNPGL